MNDWLRLLEFFTLVCLSLLSVLTLALAHYNKSLIASKRALYGLGFTAAVVATNRLMLLLDILTPEVILAYSGVVYIAIILWVVWKWKWLRT